MTEFFTRLFDPSGFVPRQACGDWTPGLVWLHNVSDALIWLAYLAIPLVLLVIASRRKDVPFRAVYFLFVAFILTCGCTHFLDVVMFYTPLYRLSGLVKAITAVTSCGTVVALVQFLPKALAMRSPEELEREIAERRRVEADLRQSQEHFRLLVEGVRDYAIFMLDPQGHVVTWNAGAERIKGYRVEEIAGQHFSRFYPQEAIDRGWPMHELEVARTEGRFEDEGWRVRKDGTQFWANVVITAMDDEAGRFVGYSKITRDLTARKQAEENARRLAEEAAGRRVAEENARLVQEQREQLRLVTDNAPVMLVHCDTERRYKFVNRAYADCFGLTPREVVGRTIPEVVGERAYERIRAMVDAALAGERVEREVEGPYQGTEKRRLHFTCLPTRSETGEVNGTIGVILDVTDSRTAEGLLRSITDTVPALLAYVDVEGRYRLNNRAYEQWFGQPRSGMAGRHMRDVLGESAWAVVGPNIEAALAGQTVHFESRLPYRSGGMRWIDATYTPHLGLGGAIDGAVVLVNDITGRKESETALRRSEGLFRQLANAMPQIVWMAGPDGRVDYFNERWYEYTGQPREGGGDESWTPVLHPDDLQSTFDAWDAAVRSGRDYEIEHRFENGTTGEYRWHMSRAVPVRDDAGGIVRWFGTSTDIHDKKLAEEKLKESERTYRAIGESIDYGVWVCAPDGRNTYASPSFLKLVGLTQEQCSEFGWGDILHPDEIEGTIRAWKECVRVRGKWDRVHRFRGVDGQYHSVLARGVPVEDEHGKLLCWAGINLDISRQIQAENALRQMNATLEQRVAAALRQQFDERRRAEETVFGTQVQLMDAIESLDAGFVMYGADERIVVCNAKYKEIYAECAHKLIPGTPYEEILREFVRAGAVLHTGLSEREWVGQRLHAHRHPGEPVEQWLAGRWIRISDRLTSNGSVVSLRTDITALKHAQQVAEEQALDLARSERALRESEVRFRRAFDSAPIGMALVAPDGRWLQVNRSLCEITGYTEQELLATDFQTLTHPDDLDADLGHVRQLLDGTAQTYQMEKRYFHKRGHVVHILLSASLVRDGNHQPLYFVAQIKNITQQKADEKALAANEEVLRQFIRHSPAAIAMFDQNLRYLQASERWMIDYRLAGRDIIGLRHYEVFPDIPENWRAVHRRVLAGGVERREEDPFERADGSTEWLQWECRPWRNADGEVGGIIMYTQVITERKVIAERVTASLREKEVLLKEIHHRVKNNLQVVSSLLNLQSGHTTDPAAVEMFKESRGRVKSMALIHERLYRSQDMASVNFGEYVRQLADDLHRTYRMSDGIRLELDVDVPALPIDTAIPCGLLLNELISNCFKHAFADAAGGKLRISLRRDGEANVLVVSDDGAGFPAGTDFRDTTSFGLQLVNTMVDQLDGEIALSGDRGTTFTVRFPKPSSNSTGTLP